MLPLSMAATIDGAGGGGGFPALPQIRTASSSSISSHGEICREQPSLQVVGTAARVDVAAGDGVPTGVDVGKVLRVSAEESDDEDAAARPCGNDAPHPQEEEGCVTPRSEVHVLKPLLVCPPAPRKPRVPTTKKRKQHDSADDDNNTNSSPPTPRHYFVVSLADLSAVFARRRRPDSPKRRKTAGAVPSVAAQQ